MKKMKNNGFSVIELLVSVIIVGVLLGLVLTVGRHTIKRSEFTSTLNQFVSDVAYARQLAARENRYVAVVFDATGTEYTNQLETKISGNIAAAESDADYNFTVVKRVEPMNGQQFNDGSVKGFLVNSVGETYKFPYDLLNPEPARVTVRFFRVLGAKEGEPSTAYEIERYITLTPLGGLIVEDPDEYKKSNS